MKIGFLGPIGSFSYTAAKYSLGVNNDLMAQESIADCLLKLNEGSIDSALVPIENSTEGSVTETLDYLFKNRKLRVVCELILPIKQYLLNLPQNQDKELTKIYSHPQAIAQSRSFLQKNYPKVSIQYTSSTAEAARFVANHPVDPIAAIGSRVLSELYHLAIRADEIQDLDTNNTRFWLLGELPRLTELPKIAQKCSFFLTMPQNIPGVLYQALAVFAKLKINLTKIESRPLKTVLGEYFFLVDFEKTEDFNLSVIKAELLKKEINVCELGVYDVFSLHDVG